MIEPLIRTVPNFHSHPTRKEIIWGLMGELAYSAIMKNDQEVLKLLLNLKLPLSDVAQTKIKRKISN